MGGHLLLWLCSYEGHPVSKTALIIPKILFLWSSSFLEYYSRKQGQLSKNQKLTVYVCCAFVAGRQMQWTGVDVIVTSCKKSCVRAIPCHECVSHGATSLCDGVLWFPWCGTVEWCILLLWYWYPSSGHGHWLFTTNTENDAYTDFISDSTLLPLWLITGETCLLSHMYCFISVFFALFSHYVIVFRFISFMS